MSDDLLTTREAARLLKTSPAMVRRWIKQGRLPATKLGGARYRLSRTQLLRLVERLALQEQAHRGRRADDEDDLWEAAALEAMADEYGPADAIYDDPAALGARPVKL